MEENNANDSCPTATSNVEMSDKQLKDMLHQLSEQGRNLFNENKRLKQLIEELDMNNFFKRLDYLFHVIDTDNKFLSEEFKNKCATEIEELMTQPVDKEEPDK